MTDSVMSRSLDLVSVYFQASRLLEERLDRLTCVTWDDAMVAQLIDAIAPDDSWKQRAYQKAAWRKLELGVSAER
jgi:hypothetical protein